VSGILARRLGVSTAPSTIESARHGYARARARGHRLGQAALIYNGRLGHLGHGGDHRPRGLRASLRVNALGAPASKQVIPAMKKAGRRQHRVHRCDGVAPRGNVNTGLRGGQGSPAQPGRVDGPPRSGPAHIHVALIIVDGAVLTPSLRARMPDTPDDFFLKPEDIAETVFQVTQQKPVAWSSRWMCGRSGEVVNLRKASG